MFRRYGSQPASTETTNGESPTKDGLMGLEKTPGRKVRDRLARERYDRRAKRKSGPVVTRFVCPVCGGPHAKKDHNDEGAAK